MSCFVSFKDAKNNFISSSASFVSMEDVPHQSSWSQSVSDELCARSKAYKEVMAQNGQSLSSLRKPIAIKLIQSETCAQIKAFADVKKYVKAAKLLRIELLKDPSLKPFLHVLITHSLTHFTCEQKIRVCVSLAKLCIQFDDLDLGHTAIEAGLKIQGFPQCTGALHLYRADLLAMQEKYPAATTSYELAYQILSLQKLSERAKFEICLSWGKCVMEFDALKKARLVLEKAFIYSLDSSNPEDAALCVELHLSVAFCLVGEGDFVGAARILGQSEPSLELLEDESQILYLNLWGQSFFETGDLKNAIRCFKNALKINGDFRELQVASQMFLARAYESTGDYELCSGCLINDPSPEAVVLKERSRHKHLSEIIYG
jgi:tetratricopeptide (TPR) repeat protein